MSMLTEVRASLEQAQAAFVALAVGRAVGHTGRAALALLAAEHLRIDVAPQHAQ